MKLRERKDGSVWLGSLAGMAVIALVVLAVFGATPGEVMEIPAAVFTNFKGIAASRTADASEANGGASPATAPAADADATPAPPPPGPQYVYDLDKLSKTPADWPSAVTLKVDLDFVGLSGGKHAPAGTSVKLVSVMGKNVSVQFGGSEGIVPAENTNLRELVIAAHTAR